MNNKKTSIGERYNQDANSPDLKKSIIQYDLIEKPKNKKSNRNEDVIKMKKFLMSMPDDMHQKLRNEAFINDTTIKDLILTAIMKQYKSIL